MRKHKCSPRRPRPKCCTGKPQRALIARQSTHCRRGGRSNVGRVGRRRSLDAAHLPSTAHMSLSQAVRLAAEQEEAFKEAADARDVRAGLDCLVLPCSLSHFPSVVFARMTSPEICRSRPRQTATEGDGPPLTCPFPYTACALGRIPRTAHDQTARVDRPVITLHIRAARASYQASP